MTAPTHRIGGLAAGALAAAVLRPGTVLGCGMVAAALLGSLLPDIDNKNSSISRRWRLFSCLVTAGQRTIRLLAYILPAKQRRYVASLIGHRGLTHSLCPVILLPSVCALIGQLVGQAAWGWIGGVGLAAGILSHLVLDMLSGGVPLFMPFSTKRVCLAHIRTGGAVEWLFRMGMLVVLIYLTLEVATWQR